MSAISELDAMAVSIEFVHNVAALVTVTNTYLKIVAITLILNVAHARPAPMVLNSFLKIAWLILIRYVARA